MGGGGSIACSKDKRVSYRRFGLMSYFQTERINERLHPLIKGLREIMRSRLSKFTASGLIIGARDYYPKVILLFVCDSHAIVNHCKIIQSSHSRASKPLNPQSTPPPKNPCIEEIGRGDINFFIWFQINSFIVSWFNCSSPYVYPGPRGFS